jgi:hypothetical protein
LQYERQCLQNGKISQRLAGNIYKDHLIKTAIQNIQRTLKTQQEREHPIKNWVRCTALQSHLLGRLRKEGGLLGSRSPGPAWTPQKEPI